MYGWALPVYVSMYIYLHFYLRLFFKVEAGRQPRISGREDVSIKDVPYMGTLRKLQNESMSVGSGYICVATVIQNRVLITTACCIYRWV